MGGSSRVVIRQALFQIACKAHIALVGVGYAPEKVDILHGHHPLLKRMMLQPAKGMPYFARAPCENLRSLELRRLILRSRWLSAFAEATADSPSSEKTQDGLPSVAPNLGITVAVRSEGWWRRGESNPRPKILYPGPLRAFPVIWVSSPGTLAGKVPFGPSREKARPSAPREEASGYPVRVTSLRLYGHSTVGGRRLKPPELTDSRWRLLVSRFLRGAGPRHATHEHRHPRRSRFAPLQCVL